MLSENGVGIKRVYRRTDVISSCETCFPSHINLVPRTFYLFIMIIYIEEINLQIVMQFQDLLIT